MDGSARCKVADLCWASGSHNGLKKISKAKERDAQRGTPEIKVMTDAVPAPPLHERKQVKRFGDVSEDDNYEETCS